MTMLASLNSATLVGTLGSFSKNLTVERMTEAGAWGIDRDTQEKVFREFPKKPLVLISYQVFDSRKSPSEVRNFSFLLLEEESQSLEVIQEILGHVAEEKAKK